MTIRRSLLLASLLALTLPAAVSAAPTAVHVRVEGLTSTIFDGPVTTDGKTITTPSGGSHVCDGTNGGANPTPGPTLTSALDDASAKGGFTWDGAWSDTFSDFTIDRVGPDAKNLTTFQFWGLFVNEEYAEVGGCQFQMQAGDEVLWAYDAFNQKDGVLSLTGDGATRPGAPVNVRVTKSRAGSPVAGASVGSQTTDADGAAQLTFADPGIYQLKANHPQYVRSRSLTVCVDPPPAEACTFGDKTGPVTRIDAPKFASDLARFGRVPLSWQGDDGAGSGVKRYRVELRHVGEPDSAWRPLLPDGTSTKGRLDGVSGVAYEVRVRAYDRANNVGMATAMTIVPLDNLSHRLRFSKRDWKVLGRLGAWQLSTSRATRRGASLSLKFKGTQATVITRKLPRGGKLRLSVDGNSRVVNLRGKTKLRKQLIRSAKLKAGDPTLRLTSLGKAPVEVDAIAVQP